MRMTDRQPEAVGRTEIILGRYSSLIISQQGK